MPKSKAPSTSLTASSSRASRNGGVQLTPSDSTASSTCAGGAVVYTPSMTSDASRALRTTSTSLNAVFAKLDVEDRRNSLRNLPKQLLSEALGCTQKELQYLIISSSSDELWAAFCQLNVENRKKTLESVRKLALRKAFEEAGGNGDIPISTSSAALSIAPPSEATTNTLTSFFKKLSVEDQERALAAIQLKEKPENGSQQAANGWNLNELRGEDKNETLIEKPNLAEWQELCRACGVEPEEIPISITKCKEVCSRIPTVIYHFLISPQILKTKNVALSDLSEAIQQGTVAQTFPSLGQLRKHVTAHNKVANKAATKQNKFLKKMLRELFRHRSARPAGSE